MTKAELEAKVQDALNNQSFTEQVKTTLLVAWDLIETYNELDEHYHATLQKCDENNAELANQLIQFKADKAELKATYDELYGRLNTAITGFEDRIKTIDELVKTCEEFKVKFAEVDKTLADLDNAIKANTARIETNEQNIATNTQDISTINETLLDHQAQIDLKLAIAAGLQIHSIIATYKQGNIVLADISTDKQNRFYLALQDVPQNTLLEDANYWKEIWVISSETENKISKNEQNITILNQIDEQIKAAFQGNNAAILENILYRLQMLEASNLDSTRKVYGNDTYITYAKTMITNIKKHLEKIADFCQITLKNTFDITSMNFDNITSNDYDAILNEFADEIINNFYIKTNLIFAPGSTFGKNYGLIRLPLLNILNDGVVISTELKNFEYLQTIIQWIQFFENYAIYSKSPYIITDFNDLRENYSLTIKIPKDLSF